MAGPVAMRHVSVKGNASVLLAIHFFLSFLLWAEAAHTLLRDYHHFYSETFRTVLKVCFAISLLWFFLTIMSFYAIIINRPMFLIPHFIFNCLLVPLMLLMCVAEWMTDTRDWTLLYTSGVTILIVVTPFYEYGCFRAMRYALRH